MGPCGGVRRVHVCPCALSIMSMSSASCAKPGGGRRLGTSASSSTATAGTGSHRSSSDLRAGRSEARRYARLVCRTGHPGRHPLGVLDRQLAATTRRGHRHIWGDRNQDGGASAIRSAEQATRAYNACNSISPLLMAGARKSSMWFAALCVRWRPKAAIDVSRRIRLPDVSTRTVCPIRTSSFALAARLAFQDSLCGRAPTANSTSPTLIGRPFDTSIFCAQSAPISGGSDGTGAEAVPATLESDRAGRTRSLRALGSSASRHRAAAALRSAGRVRLVLPARMNERGSNSTRTRSLKSSAPESWPREGPLLTPLSHSAYGSFLRVSARSLLTDKVSKGSI